MYTNIIKNKNNWVFLETLMIPVSPWTLSAPDQLVRYMCHTVWLVLCGRTVS
jgi:hypothetical protein